MAGASGANGILLSMRATANADKVLNGDAKWLVTGLIPVRGIRTVYLCDAERGVVGEFEVGGTGALMQNDAALCDSYPHTGMRVRELYDYAERRHKYGLFTWRAKRVIEYDEPVPVSEFGKSACPIGWCYVEQKT